MGTEKLLDVKNLTISFHTYVGEVAAIRNVDFHLKEGEVLAIVGESGCGKTVSTKAILGLTPIPPGEIKTGKILFKNRDLLKLDEKELSKICGDQISMIFQDPMSYLNPTMTAGNQIREVLHQHNDMNRRESKDRAIDLMMSVGIPEPKLRIKQYPHELSGGMKQRIMIAIAMANRPDILIADEPTTSLDVTIQEQIFYLLKELKMKYRTALILITHNFGVVAGIADRVVIMYAGKVMEEGEVEQIYYDPYHPYTASLLNAVPSIADDYERKLRTIKGSPPFLLNVPPGCPFAERCDYLMEICIKKEPPYFRFKDNRRVACWLYHDLADSQLQRFKEREVKK